MDMFGILWSGGSKIEPFDTVCYISMGRYQELNKTFCNFGPRWCHPLCGDPILFAEDITALLKRESFQNHKITRIMKNTKKNNTGSRPKSHLLLRRCAFVPFTRPEAIFTRMESTIHRAALFTRIYGISLLRTGGRVEKLWEKSGKLDVVAKFPLTHLFPWMLMGPSIWVGNGWRGQR